MDAYCVYGKRTHQIAPHHPSNRYLDCVLRRADADGIADKGVCGGLV